MSNTKLVTSYTQHSTDASFSGFAGGLFTYTGPNGASAVQLGLFKCSGNTVLPAYLVAYPSLVLLATVSIDMTSSTNGTFTYGDIAPVALTTGSQYILYMNPSGQNFSGQDGGITMNGGVPISSGLGLSGVTGAYTAEQVGAFQYVGIDLVYTSNLINTILLTSGTTWTVPADWTTAGSIIECIGGGGAACSYVPNISGGGGGGGYAKSVGQALTPGQVVNMSIGPGGSTSSTPVFVAPAGGDTWIANNNTATLITSSGVICGAKAGGGSSNGAPGSGGAATSAIHLGTGSAAFNGGTGRGGASGGGGGGAAGPNGAGGSGNGDSQTTNGGAGGGGGNGGGSSSAFGTSTAGANGGNNSLGTGGGSGATVAGNGSPGTLGGGGGGSLGGGATANGGNGGNGIEWGSFGGSGGGGGEGGFYSGVGNGGAGGLYGGGGGSTCSPTTASFIPGPGAKGAILITYISSGIGVSSGAFRGFFKLVAR